MKVGFGLSVYGKVTAECVWTKNAQENILTEEVRGAWRIFNNKFEMIYTFL
jgi:hypothetical protein